MTLNSAPELHSTGACTCWDRSRHLRVVSDFYRLLASPTDGTSGAEVNREYATTVCFALLYNYPNMNSAYTEWRSWVGLQLLHIDIWRRGIISLIMLALFHSETIGIIPLESESGCDSVDSISVIFIESREWNASAAKAGSEDFQPRHSSLAADFDLHARLYLLCVVRTRTSTIAVGMELFYREFFLLDLGGNLSPMGLFFPQSPFSQMHWTSHAFRICS